MVERVAFVGEVEQGVAPHSVMELIEVGHAVSEELNGVTFQSVGGKHPDRPSAI